MGVVQLSDVHIKALKAIKTAVEGPEEHSAKRTGSRMLCFSARPQPKRYISDSRAPKARAKKILGF